MIFNIVLTAKRAKERKDRSSSKEHQDRLCALRVILATFAVTDLQFMERSLHEQKNEMPVVFEKLKKILLPFAPKLVTISDNEKSFYLDTSFIMENKKPLFFAAVRIAKAYVSFYLMPVYVFPELLKGISPELKKRMQGKSCFNFSAVDEKLFEELAQLTKAGFAKYKQAKYV